jgi:Zn-dependent protease/predicted transcriptional regulator
MRGWRIGKIMGIDIAVDASWFIIVLLMIYALGFVEFPRELNPLGTGSRFAFPRADWVSITLGVVVTLLLFASVLAHELSHSWMAIQRGVPVARITLFIFGGVAQIVREPDSPSTEFLIAIMGPLMSLALAAIFGAIWMWTRVFDAFNGTGFPLLPIQIMAANLALINGQLALFNLAPGFPLDGGRVLRAVLWGVWKDFRRATWWATRVGRLIALLMIVGGGIVVIIPPFNLSGAWFVLIGFFLWNAAGEGYQHAVVVDTLQGIHVAQVMTRDIANVSPDLSIDVFVEQYLIPRRDQVFAVGDGQVFYGVISISNVRRVPRTQWALRTVRNVMTPSTALQSLSTDQDISSALARISGADAEELPVMEAGQLVGFIGRAEITRFLQLKS